MRARVSLALVVAAIAPTAARAEGRFGVADVSTTRAPDALIAGVEKEVARLRPGMVLLEDANIRRAMGSGETPDVLASRLLTSAAERKTAGDCAGAVAQANEAEAITLGGVPIDDERDNLKMAYALVIDCEHQLGHTAEAKAAGTRLRWLTSLPPTGLSREMWDKYAALPGDAATAAPTTETPTPTPTADAGAPVAATAKPATPAPAPKPTPKTAVGTELQIDTDPPNARVAVNFHGEGVTPRTLKVPPGTVYVEVEKESFKKTFRKLTVGEAPARTVFRLIERSRDRADSIRSTVTAMRGNDPTRRKGALSRLCQAARIDMLVLMQVSGDRVKIWFFDPERGDLTGDPIDSHFDAATGRVDELAARKTPPGAAGSEPKPSTATASAAPPAATGAGATAATTTTTASNAAQTKPAASASGSATPTAVAASKGEGLPEATTQSKNLLVPYNPHPWSKDDDIVWRHWWSWAIAAGVVAGIFFLVRADQASVADTVQVKAHWDPNQPQ